MENSLLASPWEGHNVLLLHELFIHPFISQALKLQQKAGVTCAQFDSGISKTLGRISI